MASLEESELLERVRAQDADALLGLYRLYGSRLFMLALRVVGDRGVAEEVVQDTFWKLWRRPDLYDPSRGELLAWLYRVGRNLALDHKRRQGRAVREYVPESLEGVLHGDRRNGASGAAHRSVENVGGLTDPCTVRAIREAVESLPAEQRDAIELAYFEGMTQSEISAHMGTALGTVKTRLRLGLNKLRDQLGEDRARARPKDFRKVGP